MAGPSTVYSAAGKDATGTTIYNAAVGAGTTTTISTLLDFSSNCVGGIVAFRVGTSTGVAATHGATISLYEQQDSSGTNFETVPSYTYPLSGFVASSNYGKNLTVRTGIYQAKVQNLDATNGLSSVQLTATKIA